MKIKRKFLIPALVLVSCMFFAACGSSYKEASYASDNAGYYSKEGGMAYSESFDSLMPSSSKSMSNRTNSSGSYKSDGESMEIQSPDIVSRKVIITANLQVQTLTFEEFIETLNKKVLEFDGYVENVDISGNNIYSTSTRYASYTIRVPEGKIKGMIDSIGEFGTVTSSNYNEDDITLAYADVESRIKTLTTEQETLLGLLERAKDLNDIIRLEERLSEVNYQLESYKSRQRTYDNKISYSTLHVYVTEVARLATVVEPEPQTLGQRIATGFKENMQNIKSGIENFIVWFLSYIVNIILFCGIVACVVIFGIKKINKRKAAVNTEEKEKSDNSDAGKMGTDK